MQHNHEHTVESRNDKGVLLESTFCGFMKFELGWNKARTRAQLNSKFNSKGTNVDIVAERNNQTWLKVQLFARISLLLVAGLVAYAIYSSQPIIGMAAFAFMSLCGVFMTLGSLLYKEHAWVECKNQKERVSYAQMQKMVAEYEAYKASPDKEYRFVECYFVAANGFNENALKFAQDKSIRCYIVKNGIFVKTDYWNN